MKDEKAFMKLGRVYLARASFPMLGVGNEVSEIPGNQIEALHW